VCVFVCVRVCVVSCARNTWFLILKVSRKVKGIGNIKFEKKKSSSIGLQHMGSSHIVHLQFSFGVRASRLIQTDCCLHTHS